MVRRSLGVQLPTMLSVCEPTIEDTVATLPARAFSSSVELKLPHPLAEMTELKRRAVGEVLAVEVAQTTQLTAFISMELLLKSVTR